MINYKIILGMLLIAIPLIFVWQSELVFYSGEANRLYNGFGSFDGMQTYHLLMYLTFAIAFLGSYVILS